MATIEGTNGDDQVQILADDPLFGGSLLLQDLVALFYDGNNYVDILAQIGHVHYESGDGSNNELSVSEGNSLHYVGGQGNDTVLFEGTEKGNKTLFMKDGHLNKAEIESAGHVHYESGDGSNNELSVSEGNSLHYVGGQGNDTVLFEGTEKGNKTLFMKDGHLNKAEIESAGHVHYESGDGSNNELSVSEGNSLHYVGGQGNDTVLFEGTEKGNKTLFMKDGHLNKAEIESAGHVHYESGDGSNNELSVSEGNSLHYVGGQGNDTVLFEGTEKGNKTLFMKDGHLNKAEIESAGHVHYESGDGSNNELSVSEGNSLHYVGGQGNDTVLFEGTEKGNKTLFMKDGHLNKAEIESAGHVHYESGDGSNNELSVSEGNSLHYVGGQGNDTVLFEGTEKGNKTLFMKDGHLNKAEIESAGHVHYESGDGSNNKLTVGEADTVHVVGGQGTDEIEVKINNNGSFHLKGGNDQVTIEGRAQGLFVDGAGGFDTVYFDDISESEVDVTHNADGTIRFVTAKDGSFTYEFNQVESIKFNSAIPVNEAPTDLALDNTSVDEVVVGESVPGNGVLIGTLSAVDPEGGSISYALADDPSGALKVVGDKLYLNSAISYESLQSFEIKVSATDADSVSSERTFTINVNDLNDKPTDLSLSGNQVAEDASEGTVIGSLSVVDEDSSDSHDFELVSNPNAQFRIENGQLVVDGTLSAGEHEVSVEVTDAEDAIYTENFTIQVDEVANEAPTDLALDNTSVDEVVVGESVPGNGVLIGTLSAVDPEGGSISYALADDPSGALKVVGDKLYLNSAISYESLQSFEIKVSATDADSVSSERTFTINVNDLNDKPTDLSLSGNQVAEDASEGTVIGSLSVVDEDSSDSHDFELVSNPNAQFRIENGQLVVDGTLSAGEHEVSVEVTDAEDAIYTENFTIQVDEVANEAPTDLALDNTSVDEVVVGESVPGNGVLIGTLSAVDPEGGSISYALADDPSGALKVVGDKLYLDSAISYESLQSFEIKVSATDADSVSSERTFTINVNDLNDKPTDLSLSGNQVAEDASEGTVIGSLSVVDEDSSDSHDFELVSNPNAQFRIENGQLVVDGTLSAGEHEVSVEVTDAEDAIYTENFTIQVDEVNNDPVTEDPKGLYVSATNGSDSTGDGSMDNPFASLEHAGNVMRWDSSYGDKNTVYAEGTFRETLELTKWKTATDGTASEPITYKAWTGKQAVISATEELEGSWESLGNNIWKLDLNANPNAEVDFAGTDVSQQQVFINGTMATVARWPNIPVGDAAKVANQNLAISDDGGSGYLKDSDLSELSGLNLSGAKITAQTGKMWFTETGTVNSVSGDQINFSISGDTPGEGNSYFLYGDKELLDAPYEFYYEQSSNSLYVVTPDGMDINDASVEAKARTQTLFMYDDDSSLEHFHFEDIEFFGGTLHINAGNTQGLVFDNIKLSYANHDLNYSDGQGLDAGYNTPDVFVNANGIVIQNSTFEHSSGRMINISQWSKDVEIINNEFENIGYSGVGSAIIDGGANTHIADNTISSTSGQAIQLRAAGGGGGLVENNHIHHNGYITTDFAAIDINNGGFANFNELTVRNNYIHDIDPNDIYDPTLEHWGGYGIRVDGGSNINIYDNLIHDVSSAGLSIELRGNQHIDLHNNTVDGDFLIIDNGNSVSNIDIANNIVTGELRDAGFDNAASELLSFNTSNPNLFESGTGVFYDLVDYQPMGLAVEDAGIFTSSGSTSDVFDGAPDLGAFELGLDTWLTDVGFQG